MTATRPEIWRLAKYLYNQFAINPADWAVADKFGWYEKARGIHNYVYLNNSPHVRHEIPVEVVMAKYEASR